jgi:hypothetical protein
VEFFHKFVWQNDLGPVNQASRGYFLGKKTRKQEQSIRVPFSEKQIFSLIAQNRTRIDLTPHLEERAADPGHRSYL